MPTYIALLRGINVGGHKVVKMADLQKRFESFGATSIRTYIQSGNVVFKHRASNPATLRRQLEAHLEKKLGFAVPTLVKTADELAQIVKANPQDETLPEFGGKMYVCFFETTPPLSALAALAPYINEKERLVLNEFAAYAYYADGLGRAKLSNALIERKLGLATLRNWNTVTALLAMAAERAD